MNEIEILENYLCGKVTSEMANNLLLNSTEPISKVNPIIRAISCFNKGYFYDGLGHLRQSIVYYHRAIHINGLWFERCKKYEKDFGFYIDEETNTVDVVPWAMDRVDGLKFEYEFALRRRQKKSIGDSALVNFFGFPTYTSLQQKMMMYSLKKMVRGDVLLACIPTGSGKSLLWQYAVSTGKFRGITIVIVPTNALATDHIQSDKVVLNDTPWIKSIAYSAAQNQKDENYLDLICDEIKSGSDMILYISPEGLTNSRIKKALLDASAHDYVAAVIVDEAHLMVDWGMHFRPEFQLIPALCRHMNKQHKIYTVLLSATITMSDAATLRDLFSYGEFCEYRGDELRPEVEFYSHNCASEKERCEILRELIPLVPKPAILYVGTKEQCGKYYRLIQELGIKRVQVFTGDTIDIDRERIIQSWRSNEIDVMVATSAFGMGVDKADVRTIITSYLPENISRFYQEVGRAGRDGYSALSFSLICHFEDDKVADSFTDSRLLTVDSLLERWNELKANAEPSEESDCIWINTSNAPKHLKHSITGGRNSGWNQDVLLLMARCGYLEVEDVIRDFSSNYKAFKMKVRVKRIAELDNAALIEQSVSEFRDNERTVIVEGKQSVRDMYSIHNEMCYSTYFTNEFIYAAGGCNGCPACRKNEYGKWFPVGDIQYYSNRRVEKQNTFCFANALSSSVNQKSKGMFFFEAQPSDEIIRDIAGKLLLAGADYLVLNNVPNNLIEDIRWNECNTNIIVTLDEVIKIPYNLICGTVVFFMTGNETENRQMLLQSEDIMKACIDINVIYICPRDYYYNEEQHYLRDCLEYSLPVNVVLQEEVIC